MFSSRGTVRYEERGQGYRDVEKVGKHCSRYCSWFADIGPAFKLNTRNLEGVGWGSALTEMGIFL